MGKDTLNLGDDERAAAAGATRAEVDLERLVADQVEVLDMRLKRSTAEIFVRGVVSSS